MSVRALLHKDLQQHAGVFAATVALWAAAGMVAMSLTLSTQSDTLLAAGTGQVYYIMPFMAAFVVRRLVVLEYTEDTQSFLAALPLSAATRAAVKYTLGFGLCLALALGGVLSTAFVVQQQEIISAAFLATAMLQTGALVFAWHGLCFCAAHLGRYRTTAWLLLYSLAFSMEKIDPDVWKHTLWTSALGNSLDETRGTLPLVAIAVSLLWGTVSSVIGIALATWRQGSQVASWYGPMATGERSILVVLVVAGVLTSNFMHQRRPESPTYTSLSQVSEGRTVVRSSSTELAAVGIALGDALDGIGDALEVDDWPEVSLVPVLEDARRPVVPRSSTAGELVLEVDRDQPAELLLSQSLRLVLVDRTAGLPLLRPGQAWVLDGAASWWLDTADPTSLERRAGYAATTKLTADDLADSERLRLRLGPDVTQAVGWAGLKTLEEHGGRPAVIAVLKEVIQPQRANLAGALATSARSPDTVIRANTDLDTAGFHAAWLATMRQYARTHATVIAAFTPAWGQLTIEQNKHSGRRLHSQWDGPLPSGLRLMWVTADQLHHGPIHPLRDDVEPVEDSSLDIPVPVDHRIYVATTYRLYVDDIQGELWSGLEVHP